MTKLIAELCQNHQGDFDNVESMVSAAANSGATHVKIQTIFADDLTFRPQFENGLVVDGVVKSIKRPFKDEYERLKSLELTYAQMTKFVELSKSYNVIPMTTCFTRKHSKIIHELGFEQVKVASYDCASFQLLRELKGRYSFILVSTGATYDDEISKAANVLEGDNFAFLHCVTLYPTPLSEFNLARMQFLKKFCPTVGLSDHSLYARDGVFASIAAIYLGADIIERHFTIFPQDQTKDGPVSIDSEGLKQIHNFSTLSTVDQKAYLDDILPDWQNILIGNSLRPLSETEILNRNYYRGRFASNFLDDVGNTRSIYNWDESFIK